MTEINSRETFEIILTGDQFYAFPTSKPQLSRSREAYHVTWIALRRQTLGSLHASASDQECSQQHSNASRIDKSSVDTEPFCNDAPSALSTMKSHYDESPS